MPVRGVSDYTVEKQTLLYTNFIKACEVMIVFFGVAALLVCQRRKRA